MSRPAKAMSRGPAWPLGTPAGKGPQLEQPQAQTSRCCWYSVTLGWKSGSSQTWWRSGCGSLPVSPRPQRRQAVGTHRTTCWHWSVGSKARRCWGWPGWPPGRRRPLGLGRGGLACGCAAEGGSDELVESLPSLTSSSATRCVRIRICSACQPSRAATAGGKAAQTSGVSSWGTTMITVTLRETAAPG